MENSNTRVRIKVWIECETGETLFGEGQLKILEAIENYGSISAAAKSMRMGYRSMWGRLKKIEQRMGKPLLIRQKGGVSGGQSILTPEAKVMVHRFKQLQVRLNDVSGKIFKDIYLG
ncbi:LysR family transcriptional regulator [Desulfobacula sp.]|uniref:winged helix-turn-helix domain-containing protein n=1 Tax=Desulfobacula sp. TaxID=2593537 RepID=UPI0026253182|nr:LysR family transcriptional regulator [Desulfobacula sp.]